MAYDEGLAQRIRDLTPTGVNWNEKKMFGGLAFMYRGHMTCGIVGDELMLRLGDAAQEALQEPHTRPMDFTGKPMRTMLYVTPEGIADDSQLRTWIERALNFNQSQTPK